MSINSTNIGKAYLKPDATIRSISAIFGIPKSTIHKILRDLSGDLGKKVRKKLTSNALEAPMRGGLATKKKYAH